jgi:5-carboxymethyl-2-hydroxymuconate isomerase
VADVRLLAPVTPGKVLAVGQNYLDHIREQGVEPPGMPLLFAKFPSSVIGPGEEIRWTAGLTEQVDYEAELAVVIGRTATRVGVEAALEHVFGYTGANDVSARDLQFGDGQWTRGKGLDRFLPLGPVVVEAGDVLLTGTPSGVGYFREPQLFLSPGDTVEVEIWDLGDLSNPVGEPYARAATALFTEELAQGGR